VFDLVSYILGAARLIPSTVAIMRPMRIPAKLIFPITLDVGSCLLVPVPSLLLKVGDKKAGRKPTNHLP